MIVSWVRYFLQGQTNISLCIRVMNRQLQLNFQVGLESRMEGMKFSRLQGLGYKGLQVGTSMTFFTDWGRRVRELLHVKINIFWSLGKKFINQNYVLCYAPCSRGFSTLIQHLRHWLTPQQPYVELLVCNRKRNRCYLR